MAKSIAAAPASPVDETKVPHYFGPYPNWANSQQVLTNAVVTVDPPVAGTTAEAVATVDPRTGGISSITVTNPGSGYDAIPNVVITSPGVTPTKLAFAAAEISTGVLSSIAVDNSGFGYLTPTVTISGGTPSAGYDATALASGGVDYVELVSGGSDYLIEPVVVFDIPDLPNGVRAEGVANMNEFGVVTDVTVTNPGSGYSFAPGVTIKDGGGIATNPAVVTATISVDMIDIVDGSAGYASTPDVFITDSTGFGDGASATATISDMGAVTNINVTVKGAGYLTPGIRKFVDTLPKLGPGGMNNLGQYIPVGVPDRDTYPGTDYYEIAVVQYRMKFHTDLPATLLRGYVQLSTGVVPGNQVTLTNAMLDGSTVEILGYKGVDNPHYLGPTIVATKDRPVRILFRNLLPTGVDGNLFLPVDTSLMGSGAGPNAMTLGDGTPGNPLNVPEDMALDEGSVMDEVRNPYCTTVPKPADCFAENRATLHLHGGITPWISDGTPHQWITPAGENTDYPQGVSVSNVPDMDLCGPVDDGCQTFFYTNQQSARLMFYHDHAWGITRLNVYAGEAAGYVITDETENALFNTAGDKPGAPFADLGIGTPLIVQDKTFVPTNIAQQDPTWQADKWGGTGSLWTPHVYMPAQNPGDPSGMSSFGRWMYGPWFWPPATDIKYSPIDNPYYNMDPKGPDLTEGTADDFSTPLAVPCNIDDPATWQYQTDPFCEPSLIPATGNISVGMEAFNDTPLVNGTVYPKTTVDPKAYRFRILNAANDRFWNLSWYVADPRTGTLSEVALNPVELAAAQTDPVVSPTPDTRWSPKGPSWIQIGTEGGFLPAPVILPASPTVYITDPTRFDVGNVDYGSLILAPAERADVIVDFSRFRGKTLILYNDAPAAFPARVPGYDYYTGGPDLSPAGAPTTLAGYGPNTRTIMKVTVSTAAAATAFDVVGNTTTDRLAQLQAAFAHHLDVDGNPAGVFETGQNPIIVGQSTYNTAYGSNFASSGWCSSPSNPTAKCDGYARIAEGSQPTDLFKFDTLSGDQLSIKFEPKGIHDEMNSATFDEFGRMTANLGLEAPGATPLLQNIILYPYVNPSTEILDATSQLAGLSLNVTPISAASADGTQIWKITHNGVDTHPIHFHLYDVQLINRVAWDNIITPPAANELGWKDTVRINPLQDTIVAVRPIIPTLPFGLMDSERVLNPMMPEGAVGSNVGLGQEAGFSNIGPTGQALPARVANEITNFGWEYVYHCHILSHEEMDMMRPVILEVGRALPAAPVLSATRDSATGPADLSWTDGTPVDYLDPTTWGDLSGEVGYRIERADGAGAFAPIDQAVANATSYSNLGLVPTETYHYRVVAFNAAGETVSNEVTVIPHLPADPTALDATSSVWNQVDLTWTDNATDETGFIIQRALVTGGIPGLFSTVDTIGANITSYSDTTVTQRTDYAYRVYSTNQAGDSLLPSNTAMVTTPNGPPADPSALSAVQNIGTSVDLTWTDNSDNEDNFVIERAVNGGAFVPDFATLPADTTTYTDSAATAGNTYDYRVMATNVVGLSTYSSAYSNVATVAVVTPPAVPTNLTATLLALQQSAQLTWRDNTTTETGFVIERSFNGGAFSVLTTVAAKAGSGTNVTYTDLGLLPGNVYTYRVRAVNGAMSSVYSNTAFVGPVSAPTAPTNLTGTLINNPLRVNVTWRDNTSTESNFILERSVNGGGFTFLANVPYRANLGNTVTYADTSVLLGNTYDYRVLSMNVIGSSPYSNTFSITTLPPTAPSDTSVIATLNGATDLVTFTWTDNSNNETSFLIQRATNATFTTGLANYVVGANLATYQISGVTQGVTYYYRIVARNTITGNSVYVNFTPFPIVTP
ncbi:MAG: multicopper oxidase domain-containing protein [Chloroflexi bacterium]|nr:multicopper oxidase domain-containing protein [Chloroflexota bacterium]